MENIFFLIVVAIVGAVQLMMRFAEARKNAQGKKQSAPPAQNAPIPRAPAESEEERVRKFFEALGVPPTTLNPPRRVQPRELTPNRPRPKGKIMPVDPFPMPRAGTPVPPVIIPTSPRPVPEPPPLPTRETTVLTDRPAAATQPRAAAEFEVRDVAESIAEDRAHTSRETARAIPTSRAQAGSIVARLATAEGLRDAIILREIFGPPRSMQTMQRR